MENIILFLSSLQEAVEAEQREFTCPICGSTAEWSLASGNGHVHCSCKGCGIKFAE